MRVLQHHSQENRPVATCIVVGFRGQAMHSHSFPLQFLYVKLSEIVRSSTLIPFNSNLCRCISSVVTSRLAKITSRYAPVEKGLFTEGKPSLLCPRFSLTKQPRCPLIKPGLLIEVLRCAVMLVITTCHRCMSEAKPLTYNCLREGECSHCPRSM